MSLKFAKIIHQLSFCNLPLDTPFPMNQKLNS
jgi:hypothetical protein